MIKWSAPEFEYMEKSEWWYWTLITIAIILGAISLWQRNFLFLIFTIIATMVIVIWSKEKPKNNEFSLDNKGLWIDKRFYDYKTFHSFAFRQAQGDLGSLQLKNKGRFRLYVAVPVPEENIAEIKSYLLAFLPEVEYNESAIDVLSKMLRF